MRRRLFRHSVRTAWIALSASTFVASNAFSQQPAGGSLFEIARAGSPSEIRRLVGAGVAPDSRGGGGTTALHVAAGACRVDNVDELLRLRAAVNPQADDGLTPLMLAAQVGCEAGVRRLLAGGADASLRNNRGETAFAYAMDHGHKALAESLRVKSDLTDAIASTLSTSCSSLLTFFDGWHASRNISADPQRRFEQASFVFGDEKPRIMRDGTSVTLLFTDTSEDALRSSVAFCKSTNATRLTSSRGTSIGGTHLRGADGTYIGSIWLDGKRRQFDSARNEWVASQSSLVLNLEP